MEEGLLLGLVALHVGLQTVALGEGLVADAALVRSLSVVGPHVDRQVFLPRTRLPTNPADEAFDAQVAPDVAVQGVLTFEEASALGAAVRRLACMNSHVGLELAVGHEGFAADDADERLLVGVRPDVERQAGVGQEGLAADVAKVRSLSDRVDLLVGLQSGGQFETLPADLAAVAPLPRVGQLVSAQRPEVVQRQTADVADVFVSAGVQFDVSSELRLQTE